MEQKLSLAAAVFFLALMLGGAACADAESPGLTVGVILPLTGESANPGRACANAIVLAQEDLPAEVRSRLTIVVEDDGNIARNTISAFQKLVATQHINALVTFFSNTSKAVAPLAEGQGIGTIAIATDPEIVTGHPHVFNLWVTPDQEARVLCRELQRRGYRRIAMISAIQPGLLAIKKAFDGQDPGVEIALLREYPVEVRDFRPFLQQLKAVKNIDAVFTNLMFGQVGIFAKQAREMRVDLPLFSVEVFEDPAEVAASAGALVGQWYVQADDASQSFLQRYLKRFPNAPTYTAGNCYDAVRLFGEAVRRGVAPRELHTFLGQVKDFSGSMGTYSATGDNRFDLPAAVKVVTKDGFEKLGR